MRLCLNSLHLTGLFELNSINRFYEIEQLPYHRKMSHFQKQYEHFTEKIRGVGHLLAAEKSCGHHESLHELGAIRMVIDNMMLQCRTFWAE